MSIKKSPTIGELSKALTKFQKAAPKIEKNREAKIGSYSYKYADLSDVIDKIRLPLADSDISYVQSPTTLNAEPALTTLLMHSSGEWIEDTMLLKELQNTPQGQGSAITYGKRYALTSMLGIVADADNDAADHKGITGIQKKRLFDTAKRVMPELGEDPLSMVRFLSEVIGKHPSRLLEEEVDDAIQSVETYTSKQVDKG